jgi:uncharacterized caspase-like protein
MKHALIIANNQYTDSKLSQLKTPDADARALAEILRAENIGDFDEVTTLVNEYEAQSRRAISKFLSDKRSDDLVLIYFSGHGVLDARGNLFLALKDTEIHSLNATALSSSFIAYEMDDCRSKRQILILDCCNSGAFVRGTKGERKAITEKTFEGNGFGRVVMTASDSTQFAFEGEQILGQTDLSLFTHFLLEGLRTGDADRNNDGRISLDEWYDYSYIKVSAITPKQTPHKWAYNQQGELIIAKNPVFKRERAEFSTNSARPIEKVKSSFIDTAVKQFEELLRSSATESELGEKVKKLKETYNVLLVDWGLNEKKPFNIDEIVASSKNTWSSAQIERFYDVSKLMADIMGGSSKFKQNLGGVTVKKYDVGANAAEASSHKINLSPRENFTSWTVVHELAHAWDANYGWKLSHALEKYTRGHTSLLHSWIVKLFGRPDSGFGWAEKKPGRYGRLPGCNAAGYFYGDKPSSSNWSFNRKEDFAESVAMYIGWGRNNILSEWAKARIDRYLLPDGVKDTNFGVDNWSFYKKYFYPENGDYSKTKRWQFVDDLVHGKLNMD